MYPWSYRCSLCQKLFDPDETVKHTQEEKAKPGWPGHVTYTRVDRPADSEPRDG